MPPVGKVVGRSARRSEGPDKLCGVAKYVDDYALPGSLFGATLRSTIACGRIRSVTLDPAFPWHEYMVVTADDIPRRQLRRADRERPAAAREGPRPPPDGADPARRPSRAREGLRRARARRASTTRKRRRFSTPSSRRPSSRASRSSAATRRRGARRAPTSSSKATTAAAPGAGLHRDERRRRVARGGRHARDARLAAVPALRRQGAQGGSSACPRRRCA